MSLVLHLFSCFPLLSNIVELSSLQKNQGLYLEDKATICTSN